MGLDVYGYVMAAVPYNTVVTTREEVTEVTRYNEETGAPYTKKIKETKTFIGNREVDWTKEGPQNVINSLGLYSLARDDANRYTHVGVILEDIEYDNARCELPLTLLSVKCLELKEMLAAIGITDAEPQIVFGLYYSY